MSQRSESVFPENFGFRYRWGFDGFRTPFRWGLGVEVHVDGRFLVGCRVGSWLLSFGQQLDWPDVWGTTELVWPDEDEED